MARIVLQSFKDFVNPQKQKPVLSSVASISNRVRCFHQSNHDWSYSSDMPCLESGQHESLPLWRLHC